MTEKLNILVVDDEPGMLTGVGRVLQNFTVEIPDFDGTVGFAVDVATSGEEALAKIDGPGGFPPPQIVLLDLKLPGISGLDVLNKLLARGQPAGPRSPGFPADYADSSDSYPLKSVKSAESAGNLPADSQPLVIMITAFASLQTAVEATKRGAYDFLAKPFTPAELKNVVRKAAGRVIFERQARKLAKEKRQVRFEFISVLAHELKAPLAAIEGYLRVIQGRLAGPDPAVYERMFERSLVRLGGMQKLIGDLLDLTRIESGHKQRKLEPIDVCEVARACIETFLPAAGERNVTICLAGPQSGPVFMLADRGEIEIILNNLISNAVKYNRAGGRVEMTISADGALAGRVVIAVADTGIGLTAEEAGRIFDDFVRVKNEKTRGILGSGLGLSIVKKLARLYGGDVAVDSTPEAGSTFVVRISG